MIAISAMVEGASVLSVGALWWFGRDHLAVANALIYASCAVVASLGMAKFLEGRGDGGSQFGDALGRLGAHVVRPIGCPPE